MSLAKPNQLPKWAGKIREARRLLGVNQERFAELLGVSQSNVSKWEGGVYPPSPELFIKLAELLKGRAESLYFYEQAGVPKEYFEGGGAFENANYAEKFIARQIDIIQVPLLHDRAAAGMGSKVNERDIDYLIPMLRSQLPPSGKIVALRVKGDSMSPILLEGYVIFVNVNQRDPRHLVGRMVVASEDDGVTVKWLRKSSRTFILVPQHVTPRHEVRVFEAESDLKILGEVVKWIGYPQPLTK